MEHTISGLQCRSDYLNVAQQQQLLTVIDDQPWLSDLKRRVQHYGYRYDYSNRHAGTESYLGPLPEWAASLAQQLHRHGHCDKIPDQVIVNEYLPGQGIAGHVDCVPCFGDTVLSLSLAASCVMVFKHIQTAATVPVLLEPGSLLVMRGEARYQWKHGIPSRKSDLYEGRTIQRLRRVSITLRTIATQPA